MSRLELIDAYVAGRIGRREFIQGLVGLGVSMSAAIVHAVALRPAAADHYDDEFYDDYYGHPKRIKQCKNDGYLDFGFKKQKQCVRYVKRRNRR